MSQYHTALRCQLTKLADAQPQPMPQPQQPGVAYPQQPQNFNQNTYDALNMQGNKGLVAGALGAAGAVAGLAMKNKALAIGGGLVGAVGAAAGLKGKHDANKYMNDEDYRKKTDSWGLLNTHNDIYWGNKMGMPAWMM